MNDLMIDIETLSTKSDACILSIGACFFDLKTGGVGDNFYTVINYDGFIDTGKISLDTVIWWLNQSAAARSDIQPGNSPSLPPTTALLALNSFMLNRTTIGKPLNIWSNGSSFDLVILKNAYKRYAIKDSWSYAQERDVRTIVDICRKLTSIDPKSQTMQSGIAHRAVDDAIHQARYVSQAYSLIFQHGSAGLKKESA